jgi:hypothetical protein
MVTTTNPAGRDWTEPDVTINGHVLPFEEAMALRVAVLMFRMQLNDPDFREGLGKPLADNYDRLLGALEQAMHQTVTP